MVDKVIGDSVHAIFNAPLDVPGHATCAVSCAFAIIDFTQAFEAEPDIAAIGLGRTRIGIETGPAVVGEFGSEGKLDYTAHGSAVNTASRLEGLNKTLGTSICVGPGCRAAVTAFAFRDLGPIEIRGRGSLQVFEPLRAVV
jgi:adenylate cyclase